MLSQQETKDIDHELAKLPTRRAACVSALLTVQRSRGWVDDGALADVALHLGMSQTELESIATFYSLIFRRPVGRHVIHQCTSVSCWIMGSGELSSVLAQRLGIGAGDTTSDNRFTLIPIRCLGFCQHAPAVMVDEDTYGALTPDMLLDILHRYR